REFAGIEACRAEDDRLDALGACGECALDHRLRPSVTPHRVDCDAGHVLRSLDAERLDLAALVRAAGRADAMRALRLAARRADVDLRRADRVRGTPLVAAGLGGFPLRDGHDRRPTIASARGYDRDPRALRRADAPQGRAGLSVRQRRLE